MINRTKLVLESQNTHKKDKELDHLLVKRALAEAENQVRKLGFENKEIKIDSISTPVKDPFYILSRMKEGLSKAPVKTVEMLSKFYDTSMSDEIKLEQHIELLHILANKAAFLADNLNGYFSLLAKVFCKTKEGLAEDKFKVRSIGI